MTEIAEKAWKEKSLYWGSPNVYMSGVKDYTDALKNPLEEHLVELRKQFDACTDEEGLMEEEVELSARIDTVRWFLKLIDSTTPLTNKTL